MKRLLPLLFFLSCAPEDRNSGFAKKLDAFITQQVPDGGPGGAILVMKDSTVIFAKSLGVADLQTKEPITSQTLFNLGSISKTFVAYGILLLHEQGKLSVEDDLLKYFPTFKNKRIAQKVKIKHLLTHTSGLPDNRAVAKDSVFYLTANDTQNWYPVTQTDTLAFEPGSRYQYSNPAFNGLALVIEQVSGQKWQTFIKEKIFLPCGMTTSTITDGAHPESGVAHGYTRIEGEWSEDDYGEEPTFCAAGNGGVWSSVEELARYELALRSGTFIGMDLIDESSDIKEFINWSDKKPPVVGWSWFIDKTPEGLKVISHTGHQGGFAAYYLSIPEKHVFLVALYNAPYDVYQFRERAISFLNEEKWLE